MIRIWKRHFLIIEGTAAALVGFTVAWLARGSEPPRIAFLVAPSDTIAVMAALAGTFGTLLGFAIAVIAFLFSVSGNPAFGLLRASKSYGVQWAIFKSALYACFVATAASVTGICAAWCSLLSKWHEVLIVLSSVWALLRLARVVWVMKHMIDAEVRLGCLSRKDYAGT
jgi:hypothetical protein